VEDIYTVVQDLYIINLENGNLRKLASQSFPFISRAAWLPRTDIFIYSVPRTGMSIGNSSLYCMRSDGTGRKLLISEPINFGIDDFQPSPDGKKIAFIRGMYSDETKLSYRSAEVVIADIKYISKARETITSSQDIRVIEAKLLPLVSVTKASAEVISGPGFDFKRVRTVYKGETFSLLGIEGDWCIIDTGIIPDYIHREAVQVTDEFSYGENTIETGKLRTPKANISIELQPKITERINPKDGAVMVYIPEGEFIMGTSDAQIDALLLQFPDWATVTYRSWLDYEKPQRRVYLDGYWIYKHEVTVTQYRKFCDETGHQMPEAPLWGWQDNHPIVYVSWDDAVAYCQWAGVELPTEAQWEKAARGTDGRIYPWGNEWDASKCNNYNTGPKRTTPVGSYPQGASPYGLMDMAGNVWEWCADWYDEKDYASAPGRNPQGPASGTWRMLRGGSEGSDNPLLLHTASRNRNNPLRWFVDVGFRGITLRLPR
jgi:iron(II)-dependent oxidoreductase